MIRKVVKVPVYFILGKTGGMNTLALMKRMDT